ncbi:hypothetical protein BJV82DRAFT_636353 [Fennellomyces sp. T-0311]|nr:hypothetical protein BJV82DRAFT_636353 [Fennellomyces sp. T-0311]
MDSSVLKLNETEQLMCVDSPLNSINGSSWVTTTHDKKDDEEVNSEDEQDYYVVSAPPPSPQEPSMLETVFAKQLSGALEVVVRTNSPEPDDRRPSWDHARALDKLLRKTQQEQKSIKKRYPSRLKARSLCNKNASDLADAISMIRISTSPTSSDAPHQ